MKKELEEIESIRGLQLDGGCSNLVEKSKRPRLGSREILELFRGFE